MSKLTNALLGAAVALGGFLPAAYAQNSPGGTVSGQPPTPQSELRRSLPPDIEVDRSIRSRVSPRATPRVPPPPPTQTVIPRGDAYWDDYWRWYNNDYSRNYTRFQRSSENNQLEALRTETGTTNARRSDPYHRERYLYYERDRRYNARPGVGGGGGHNMVW